MCLVAWPLNESEAGVDSLLIESSLLFLCKFLNMASTPGISHYFYSCVLTVVAWPLIDSEAGVDLVLIETSLLFLCK